MDMSRLLLLYCIIQLLVLLLYRHKKKTNRRPMHVLPMLTPSVNISFNYLHFFLNIAKFKAIIQHYSKSKTQITFSQYNIQASFPLISNLPVSRVMLFNQRKKGPCSLWPEHHGLKRWFKIIPVPKMSYLIFKNKHFKVDEQIKSYIYTDIFYCKKVKHA